MIDRWASGIDKDMLKIRAYRVEFTRRWSLQIDATLLIDIVFAIAFAIIFGNHSDAPSP